MQEKSMTAMVSAFARAYHAENKQDGVFIDSIAKSLIGGQMYDQIAASMTNGIGFFNPDFQGSSEEALRWVVDNYLSPSVLGRAAFAEKALETAVHSGLNQYLVMAAGFDTFAYRRPDWAEKVKVFEIDHPATAQDKETCLQNAGISIPKCTYFVHADFNESNWHHALLEHKEYSAQAKSFCSLLGLTYYLPKQAFQNLLDKMGECLPGGSILVFDYPDENTYTDKAGERAKKQAMLMLASGAKEAMLASYSCEEMKRLLEKNGYLIDTHLTPDQITQEYFTAYNNANPAHLMSAMDNVNYCLALKE